MKFYVGQKVRILKKGCEGLSREFPCCIPGSIAEISLLTTDYVGWSVPRCNCMAKHCNTGSVKYIEEWLKPVVIDKPEETRFKNLEIE